MLNSQLLSDFIQEFVWRMAKQNWKWVAFWAWDTGIPGAVALTAFFGVLLNGSLYVDYTRWYIGGPLFIGSIVAAISAALLVDVCQSVFLRLIGKPDYFKDWNQVRFENIPRSNTSYEDGKW